MAPRRSSSSMVSLTGISSAVVTMTTPVWAGSSRMSSIHLVWSRTRPTWTRSLMACGAASWPTMWPGGRGVDHDEVVVALAHLVAELADGEDLLHPRRGVGHEVERAGQRTEPGDEGHAQLQSRGTPAASPRCSSPWPRAPWCTSRASKRERGGLERRGQRALGVDLADQACLPRAAASSARAAAMVVLPTPPLPVTNRSRRSSRSPGSGVEPGHGSDGRARRRLRRSVGQPPKPIRRSPSATPTST